MNTGADSNSCSFCCFSPTDYPRCHCLCRVQCQSGCCHTRQVCVISQVKVALFSCILYIWLWLSELFLGLLSSKEGRIPFPSFFLFLRNDAFNLWPSQIDFTCVVISTVNKSDQGSNCCPCCTVGLGIVSIFTVKHLQTPKCCKIMTVVIRILYSFSLFLVSVYGTGADDKFTLVAWLSQLPILIFVNLLLQSIYYFIKFRWFILDLEWLLTPPQKVLWPDFSTVTSQCWEA